jgi:hypothetical protein
MEVRIKDNNGYIDADWIIENGIMVVSPKVEKFEPKDGDVVSSGAYIFVCKKHLSNDEILVYFGYDFYSDKIIDDSTRIFYADHIATEEEKKKLFDKLAEEGYEWKAETKELVKLKWKPMAGQRYYIPVICNAQFKAVIEDWSDDALDVLYFGKGWAFATKEECQEFCNRLNDAINSVKP